MLGFMLLQFEIFAITVGLGLVYVQVTVKLGYISGYI